MGRITKDDLCLIKGLRTEKKLEGGGQMPNKRVSEQHYNLTCIFFVTNYGRFCGYLWTININ